MKKTLTVNLGGTVFNNDDDAYRLLDNYLNNLWQHFRKEAGADEIVDDIERRISELFCEKQAGEPKVITLTDVEQVISRMGRPEEMEEAGENAPQDPGSSQSASIPRKRLFRDPDDKILGGVFSGLAAYFGLDVQLLRLLMFVLLFFSTGTLIIIYIICWIIIPQARTAADRLSMRGEAVTLENIGRTVTNGFERVSHGVNDYVASGKEAIAVVFHVNRNEEMSGTGYAVYLHDLPPEAFADSLGISQGTSADLTAYDGNENTFALYDTDDVSSPMAMQVFDMWRYGQSAYVPSVAQMRLLYAAKASINPYIKSCGGEPLPDDADECWYWTSTEVEGQETAKAWLFSMGSGAIQETPKLQGHKVRAIVTLYNEE